MMRISALWLLCMLLSTVACTPPTDHAAFRDEAETYIRAHITELSPEPAVLGGAFYVTDITWLDADTVQVEYEDGHIALSAEVDVHLEHEQIVVDRFEVSNS